METNQVLLYITKIDFEIQEKVSNDLKRNFEFVLRYDYQH